MKLLCNYTYAYKFRKKYTHYKYCTPFTQLSESGYIFTKSPEMCISYLCMKNAKIFMEHTHIGMYLNMHPQKKRILINCLEFYVQI